MSKSAEDDLDDGLDYQLELESDNENGPEDFLEDLSGSDDDDAREPVEKRKRDDDSEKPTKKQKKNKRPKQNAESMAQQKTQVSLYPPDMLVDHMANKVRSKNPDLSALEVDEQVVDKSCIVDTTRFTPRDDDSFAKFVEKYATKYMDDGKFVMVLCISAIRACDVMRVLKSIGCIKLIKKNKIEYDKKALSAGTTKLAATTAGRVKKLNNDGILDLDKVGAFIIDSTHLDPKSHNIWDMDDFVPTLKHIVDKSNAKVYTF